MDHEPFYEQAPDGPPPELWAEIDAARARAATFFDDELHLHIRVGRISGRVSGQLRYEDVVLEKLSPSQLLALACGDPLPLPRRGARPASAPATAI